MAEARGTDMIDPSHMNRLCPELRMLLDAELAAGNKIVETHGGSPDANSILVLLAEPFRTQPASLPPGVTFNEVNDPHWWKAEYVHEATKHVLACRFRF